MSQHSDHLINGDGLRLASDRDHRQSRARARAQRRERTAENDISVCPPLGLA